MSIDYALKLVLGFEGGLSDHEADRGGLTNHGVTQKTYDRYRSVKKLPARSVRDIEPDEVVDIYTIFYWGPAKCAQMPETVAIVHFDWAVNHGVRGAAKMLQDILGVVADGSIGPVTLAALEDWGSNRLALRYIRERRNWYLDFATTHRDQRAFIMGWLNRLRALENALHLYGKDA